MTPLTLRPLRWTDWGFARRLAADPVTRAMSEDPASPTTLGHLRWMARHVAHATAWVAIGDRQASWFRFNRLGLAQVKQDARQRLWLGVTVAPEWRGCRLAQPLIEAATQQAFAQWPLEPALWARIKFANEASIKAFSAAGYIGSKLDSEGYWVLVRTRNRKAAA